MATYVLNDDGTFPNNKRADVMRNSLENKNLLSKRGSMYIGTGTNHSVTNDANIPNVAYTSSLDPPEDNGDIANNYIIVTNNVANFGLTYQSLSNISVGHSTNTSSIYATVTNVPNVSSGNKQIVITNVLPPNPSSEVIYYILEG